MDIIRELVKFIICELFPIHIYKEIHRNSSKITYECVMCKNKKYKVIIY
jgi:hypothetical protein